MADDTNVEKKLGKIEVLALRDATGIVDNKIVGLFQDNTDLKYVYCHFPILENGSQMFWGCENLETFFTNSPDYVGILPNLENGSGMFYYTKLSEFATELPKMSNGSQMFLNCSNLKTFKSNLKTLENYYEMFKDDKLNLFEANEINVTDTGAQFMSTSGLSNSHDSLANVDCNFPKMKDTSSMFKNFTALKTFKGNFNSAVDCNYMFAYCYSYNSETNVETGLEKVEGVFSSAKNCNSMFRGCKKLTNVNCTTYSLQDAGHMFRDCSKLSQDNFNLNFFYNTLVNGIAMFQGTSFNKIPQNWNFPNLKNARQMFNKTKICENGDTFSIDMKTQFPKVRVYTDENGKPLFQGGDYPVAHMFGECPITSIWFDVSTLDNGVSMFSNCTSLISCIGAKFQNGGNYQSMFTESKFDQESAQLIFNYAKMANVAYLHIGIGFQLTEDHNFVKKNSLIKYSQDNSGKQWCEGYAYCHCHNVDEAAARDYLQQYGVTKHCHADNAVTHYFDENPSIMFVCNPN